MKIWQQQFDANMFYMIVFIPWHVKTSFITDVMGALARAM